jgi:GntR family transcriptional regulator
MVQAEDLGSPGSGGLQLRDQVKRALVSRIESGDWRPGSKVAPEADLARSMGVSRPTLREVLRGLQEDGYLKRVRGAGTFVTYRPRLRNNLDVNFGVTDLIRSTEMTPGTQDLRAYPATATRDEADRLAIPPGTPVHMVERVRTADGTPVVFSRDVIPGFVVGGNAVALERMGQESLYRIYHIAFGVVVTQGVAFIRPVAADRELAAHLDVPRNTPLLYLMQVDYEQSGRPVLLSHEYHRPDSFEFTVHRKGPGTTAQLST